eukprot:286151-Rhodomonas_salina.1
MGGARGDPDPLGCDPRLTTGTGTGSSAESGPRFKFLGGRDGECGVPLCVFRAARGPGAASSRALHSSCQIKEKKAQSDT